MGSEKKTYRNPREKINHNFYWSSTISCNEGNEVFLTEGTMKKDERKQIWSDHKEINGKKIKYTVYEAIFSRKEN